MKIYKLNFLMFLIVNPCFDGSLSVDNNLCENNRKIRPTFAEIFGQKWETEKMEDEKENNQNSNILNAIDSDQNNDQMENQQKFEIIHKFHAIKERIKKKGKYSRKIWINIEQKIANKLGISRTKIYKWKKKFGLSQKSERNQKNYYEKKRREFIERIDEFKIMSKKGKQKQFAEELGIGETTFKKWKKEFGIESGKNRHAYSNEDKLSKMNIYYEMKKGNPSLTDKKTAEFLKISPPTLRKWKKQKPKFF